MRTLTEMLNDARRPKLINEAFASSILSGIYAKSDEWGKKAITDHANWSETDGAALSLLTDDMLQYQVWQSDDIRDYMSEVEPDTETIWTVNGKLFAKTGASLVRGKLSHRIIASSAAYIKADTVLDLVKYIQLQSAVGYTYSLADVTKRSAVKNEYNPADAQPDLALRLHHKQLKSKLLTDLSNAKDTTDLLRIAQKTSFYEDQKCVHAESNIKRRFNSAANRAGAKYARPINMLYISSIIEFIPNFEFELVRPSVMASLYNDILRTEVSVRNSGSSRMGRIDKDNINYTNAKEVLAENYDFESFKTVISQFLLNAKATY